MGFHFLRSFQYHPVVVHIDDPGPFFIVTVFLIYSTNIEQIVNIKNE